MYKKLVIGFIAGIMCGLFSAGGGLILIPAFSYFLHLSEKGSRASSIFCILPMVIISSIIFQTFTSINYKIVLICSIGEIIGAIIGSKLLNKLEPKYLKIVLVFFLIYVGIKNLF